jgi:serine/threonine-protein phosphatase Stp1
MNPEPIATSIGAASRFRSWAASHPGAVRRHNEDSYVDRPDIGLWAVADGAGGHQAGDVASHIVTDALAAVPTGLSAAGLLAEVRLRLAHAHQLLQIEAARQGSEAMLVTTIVVLLARHDYFACLWAGDSRAYLLRGGNLCQVTHDHSLVQELVDAGEITPAEADNHPSRNIITRAVDSAADSVELDKVTDRLHAGDRFLLCSDGLFKSLAERDLLELIASDGDTAAERLIAAALDGHAEDNVTVVMIEVCRDDWVPEVATTSEPDQLGELPARSDDIARDHIEKRH